MTEGKKLIAMLGTLVFLLIVFWGVRQMTAEEAPLETEMLLPEFDAASVEELSWRYDDQSFVFLQAENQWSYPADESFPVSPTTMENLMTVLHTLSAEKTIPNVDDLAEYGLDAPACEIKLVSDETYTIRVGAESAMGSYRYVTMDGVTVYMVDDFLGNFRVELYAMLKQESIPVMNYVSAVKIQRKGEGLDIRLESEQWHNLDNGEETLLDSELVESFIDDLTTLYWSDTVTHHATKKQLKQYGLEQPKATLTIEYTEKTQKPTDLTDSDGNTIMETITEEKAFVLELGNSTEEGVYARLAGSDMVYEIYESYSYEILNISVENLLPVE